MRTANTFTLSVLLALAFLLGAAVVSAQGYVSGSGEVYNSSGSYGDDSVISSEWIVDGEVPRPGDTFICTQDAMQCPDGTWVGRTGQNCEFICSGGSSRTGDGYITPPELPDIGRGPGVPVVTEPVGPIPGTETGFYGFGGDGYVSSGGGVYGTPGDGGAFSSTFSALPKTGRVPLTVNFSAVVEEPSYHFIEFGDGATGEFDICAQSYPYRCALSHTYDTPGTYTALLMYDRCGNSEGNGNTNCLAPVVVVKSIDIVVRDSDGTSTKTRLPYVGDLLGVFLSYFSSDEPAENARPGVSEGSAGQGSSPETGGGGSGEETNYPGVEHPEVNYYADESSAPANTPHGIRGWIGLFFKSIFN